jgi:hypothetical protein
MRPRTRIRIQSPAVPHSHTLPTPPVLSLSLSISLFHTHTHTHTHTHARLSSSSSSAPMSTHRMHSSPWPAVAPTQHWLRDAKLLREEELVEECKSCAAPIFAAGDNHLHTKPLYLISGGLTAGSGPIGGPGLKELLLDTALWVVKQDEESSFLGSQGPSANLAFLERSMQQEVEWASSSPGSTLRERNHRSHIHTHSAS